MEINKINGSRSLSTTIMGLFLTVFLLLSFTASADSKHHSKHKRHHHSSHNGELINYLGVETTIQDRRAFFRYRLSSILERQTNYCDRYSKYFSENKQLRKYKKCLRYKVKQLKLWRVISGAERRELRTIIKNYTGETTPPTPVSTVTGVITSDSTLVENASITATAADGTIVQTTTDNNGSYSLILAPETTYSVQITAEGYVDQETTLVTPVKGVETTPLNIVLVAVEFAIVNGRITLADGSIVSNVTVTAKAADGTVIEVISDTNGYNLELTPETLYTVKFTADGFADQVSNIKSPLNNGSISLPVTMIARNTAQDVVDGAVTAGNDGATVTTNVADFVDVDGNSVEGTLKVNITPVDVSNPASIGAFPGDFSGIPSGASTESPIYSLGVVEYEFTMVAADGTETPVNLAENKEAMIEIPVYGTTYQDGTSIQIGDMIPLWSLNEDTGIWLQEGIGEVISSENSPTGLAMKATVTHFSWWNCDVSVNTSPATISVNGGSFGNNGTAVISATVEDCNIGWRPPNASAITSLGIPTVALPVPSNCSVCFVAAITWINGGLGSSDKFCTTPTPNTPFDVDLTILPEGPINILANNEEDTVNINSLVGFPVERIRLSAGTFENSVSYSISEAGDALPNGLSLISLDAISAEIAGIANTVGNHTVVITAEDEDGNTDSITINYSIIDPSSSESPIFVNSEIYLPFDFFTAQSYDLNGFNVGGVSTDWSLVEINQSLPNPAWFELSSNGILSVVGQLPSYSQWSGIVRATTAAGSAQTQIRICTGDCSSSPTPFPGDYALTLNDAFAFEQPEASLRFRVELNQAANVDISFNY